MRVARRQKRAWRRMLLLALLLGLAPGFVMGYRKVTPKGSIAKPQLHTGVERATGAAKLSFQIIDPTAYQMIVNKKFGLPATFKPPDLVPLNLPSDSPAQLRKAAAAALAQLFAAAQKQGLQLRVTSGYRSYDEQAALYKSYLATKSGAVDLSAPPGHSEHQTGLAADINPRGATPVAAAYAWLAAHGPEFGFILRYPAGKEQATGYQHEAWHFRYVGVALAQNIAHSSQVMEEYFMLPGGGYAQ